MVKKLSAKRLGGRTGVGARNHCAHGKGSGMYLTYLDWRPLDYYTANMVEGNTNFREMVRVEPLAGGDGTRLTIRMKLIMPFPHWVRKIMAQLLAKKDYQFILDRLMEYVQAQ